MSKTNFKFALAVASLALGIAAYGGEAAARTYNGNYDPSGLSGTFNFTIADSCLTLADGVYPVTLTCPQLLTGLTADLFDGTTLLAHFVYLPPGTNTPNFFSILNHNVNALDTGLIGPRFNEMVFGNVPYWLQFGIVVPAGGGAGTPFINLFDGTCASNVGDVHSGCNPNQAPLLVAHTVNFVPVPEPGTLVLLLGALGAGWLARRRPQRS